MPDKDDYNLDTLNISCGDVPASAFYVRGALHYDWGMQSRLANIFNPKSGNTVMLAFDHGYIMGPTTGLERLDIAIPPLIDDIDVLMATRGALRTCISPSTRKAVSLRCSAGSSVLSDNMSKELIGVDVQDALRINASCMAVQVFIGSTAECQSINNLCIAIDKGCSLECRF